MSASRGYCCKTRKPSDAENLANVDFYPTPPQQYSLTPIRSFVIVFVLLHIAERETHQQSSPQKDFCNNIGAKRPFEAPGRLLFGEQFDIEADVRP